MTVAIELNTTLKLRVEERKTYDKFHFYTEDAEGNDFLIHTSTTLSGAMTYLKKLANDYEGSDIDLDILGRHWRMDDIINREILVTNILLMDY
jgi:hypothetical protein